MAFFSNISSPDDTQIDEILSQAKDQSTLDQISSLNCSSFSDSALSSDLERRFQKLKTFPSSTPHPGPTSLPPTNPTVIKAKNVISPPASASSSNSSLSSSSGHMKSSRSKRNQQPGQGRNVNSRRGSVLDSSDSDEEEMGQNGGCLCLISPKRVSKKRNGEEKRDELLRTLSENHKKLLREQEKEQKKLRMWSKQLSAKMDFSLSDDGYNVSKRSFSRR